MATNTIPASSQPWKLLGAGVAGAVVGGLLVAAVSRRGRSILRSRSVRVAEEEASQPPAGAGAEAGHAGKPVRIYIDGCFDMMHYGHSNALRQARSVGDELVVGLNGDDEIVRNKGCAPVMPEEERYEALKACKFVDEVVRGAPYELTEEWVDTLLEKYHIDFIVHGDDPCVTADGRDAYAYAKSKNIFKVIKRTEGVSTTDIVGRMLLMTKEHHVMSPPPGDAEDLARRRSASYGMDTEELEVRPAPASRFLPTARRIKQFSTGAAPGPNDKVVYIAGDWDLFTAGHISILQTAAAMGDFLVVGVWDDSTVNKLRGRSFPVLNLHERALSVLACRYADEVIIGAPYAITPDLLRTMNVQVVARCETELTPVLDGEDAYAVPESMGIVQPFTAPRVLSPQDVINRVMEHRAAFENRYKSKAAKEASYHTDKAYVAEH